ILGLRRFISRRGRPSVLFSDNGTNFTSAEGMLSRLDWDSIERKTQVHRIRWRFNPPTAAWWGGWWERMVRMMKELLRSTLGKACLTMEEFMTVLCDCEAVINARPLTYMPEGEQLVPLTPSL